MNVAKQVRGDSQVLVTVKVTEATPPQANGAPVLLLDKDALQPPVKLTVANHALNLELMADCV